MAVYYSRLKPLLFADRIQALQEGRVSAPVHVRIKPVNACNHRCWYCAYRHDDLDLGENMRVKDRLPSDKLMEIAADLVEMGVRAVTFSGGGEPLLHPALPEVIQVLAKGGVKVGSLTNGALLKDRVAEVFAEHGTWIRVSMDGWDADSYARSRGVKPTEFDRVIGNISKFSALGSRCSLGISYIVNQQNADHLAEFCEIAQQAGVRHLKVSACVVSTDGAENNAYHAAISDRVREQIASARDKLSATGFVLVDHYHEAALRFDKTYRRCPFLQFLTVIGADCGVYTCQDKAYTNAGMLGSIQERSFKDFWFSRENADQLNRLNPSVDCRHHCVAHSKNEMINECLDIEKGHEVFV